MTSGADLERFDATLEVGTPVIARWTNSFISHAARAEVLKLSGKSMRVRLLEEVKSYVGTYPAGQTIFLPRPGNRAWSPNNCAAPLES